MTFPDAAKRYADTFMAAGADASKQLEMLLFTAAAVDCGTYLVAGAKSLFEEQELRGSTSGEINWRSKAKYFLEKMFDACGENSHTLRVLVLLSDMYEVDNELCTYKRSCRKDTAKTDAEREQAARFSKWMKEVYMPELGSALLELPAVPEQKTILILRGFHRTIPEEHRVGWNKNKGYGVLTGRAIWLKNSAFETTNLWDGKACLTAVEGDVACLSFAALLCKIDPYFELMAAAGLALPQNHPMDTQKEFLCKIDPEYKLMEAIYGKKPVIPFELDEGNLMAVAVSIDGDIIANSVIQHHVDPSLDNFFVMRPRPVHIVNKNGGPPNSHFYRVSDLVYVLKSLGYDSPLTFVLLMSIAGNDFVYHVRLLSPLKAEAALKRVNSKALTMRDYCLFGGKDFASHKDTVVSRFGSAPLITEDREHNTLKVNYPMMYELVLNLIKTAKSTPAVIHCKCDDELLDTCKQVYGNMPKNKKQKLDEKGSSSTAVTVCDDPDFVADEDPNERDLEYSKAHITHHELYLAATSISHYMTYILKELSLTAEHTHKVLTTEPGFLGTEQTYFRLPEDPRKIVMGTSPIKIGQLGLDYPK